MPREAGFYLVVATYTGCLVANCKLGLYGEVFEEHGGHTLRFGGCGLPGRATNQASVMTGGPLLSDTAMGRRLSPAARRAVRAFATFFLVSSFFAFSHLILHVNDGSITANHHSLSLRPDA